MVVGGERKRQTQLVKYISNAFLTVKRLEGVSASCGRQIRHIFYASPVTVRESETLWCLGRPQRHQKHHRNEKCSAVGDKEEQMEGENKREGERKNRSV